MDHRIAQLVRRPDGGVDVSAYQALLTTISLDGALDLLEIDKHAQSWNAAAHHNVDRLAAKVASAKKDR